MKKQRRVLRIRFRYLIQHEKNIQKFMRIFNADVIHIDVILRNITQCVMFRMYIYM